MCKSHGYISGEHFSCPTCGGDAEVYSRITGYYRPVQNWNDGKAQEYKDRKVYDIGRSADGRQESGAILFATKTCPNCRIAESLLEKAGLTYKKILADENMDLAEKYGIRQAPTLVYVSGEKAEKYTGVNEIRDYIKNSAALKEA